MDREQMRKMIDEENGEGYSKNILTRRTIFQKDSFLCFHFDNIDINGELRKVVIVDYIHYTNKKNILAILAIAVNFWMGSKVCLVYFEEKEKATSKAICNVLQELGMTIHIDRFEKHDYKNKFVCKWDNDDPCSCRIIEASV